MRATLFGEVVVMALDTVRTNKMRSALTVLGVVIGITAIVGMTAMIRGFDQSLRDMIGAIGPNTIFVQRFGVTNFANGAELRDLLKRPQLTISDARAIEQQAQTIQLVDIELGAGGPPTFRKVFYRDQKTSQMVVFGTSENFAEGTKVPIVAGRFLTGSDVLYKRNVALIGNTPYQVLFAASGTAPSRVLSAGSGPAPMGKMIRIGSERFEVIGVAGKRAAAGGFNLGQDDFVVIPYTVYERMFGLRGIFIGRGSAGGFILPIQVAMLPRDGVSVKEAIADVERVMRIRHNLRLDEPNDFEVMTQDAVLKLWDQISQGTFLALIVISSIALMVGGIGVMAIMSISVTERTREIGVRKALGARRAEILFQFLMEASCLTLLGGVIGILLGSAIGVAVHLVTGFPISLPWWSFAIGIGFSASVGIFFGMYPAFKASRLDPIEALRYE